MLKKRSFVIYDINYRITSTPKGPSTELLLFGKLDNGEKSVLITDRVSPYFLIDLKSIDDVPEVEKYLKSIQTSEFLIRDLLTIEKKTFDDGKTLVKITTNTPKAVPYFRDMMKNNVFVKTIYEADIPFVDRFMYDYDISMFKWYKVNIEETDDTSFRVAAYKTDIQFLYQNDANPDEFRTMSFDIETYSNENDHILEYSNPIVSIAIYSRLKNEEYYKVFTWKTFDKTSKYKDFDPENVVFCSGELDMLENFRREIFKLMPDFIVAYNSDKFDFPFLMARAKKFGVDLNIGLDFSQPIVHRDEILINGIAHIDLCNYVINVMSASLETAKYSLKNVAQELLKETKADFDVRMIKKYWDDHHREGLHDLAYYNFIDAKITYKLSEIILAELFESCKLISLPVTKISRSSSVNMLESLLFKVSISKNILVPNKPSDFEVEQRKNNPIIGAFVHEPLIGKHTDIHIFDFQSLYPTIIITKNISLDTINCGCCKDSKVPGFENIWFCTKKKGFLSEMMNDLIERRAVVKKLLKSSDLDDSAKLVLKSRSNILKLIANATFGYLNYAYARWHCHDCAEAITAYARFYIQKVIGMAMQYGFTIIYGDTDSVFLTGDNKKMKDFNDTVNSILVPPMYLDYQGHYKSGLFTDAKKRYALLDDKNNLIVKGFEVVRRNTSTIAKEVQYATFELVLNEDEFKALEYVKNVIKELKAGNFENFKKEDFAINVRISRALKDYQTNAPHIVLAKRLTESGDEKFRRGNIISYAVIKNADTDKINEKVELIDNVELKDLDIDYYIDNQIVPVVERIFAVFGITKEQLKSQAKQVSLSGFFGK